MALRLYNTLTRKKEEFEPLDPNHVRMYVCGPTVYDQAHIGNARPVVVFDVLYRLLKRLYPPPKKVTYVRNITDVDDKIIDRAAETGEPIDAITSKFIDIFHEDMAALGALPPDVEPRATAHIPQMIAMIETLIARGHAYAADGHVLFAVPSMADYGRLSRHSRDELIAGARVEVAPYKKDPADFVLWKPSAAGQPGWDSPWGLGRPGWHLECSAMSRAHLGETFDIHGGGLDLVFPHHENEIAQSRCAHGTGIMAKTWLHNGYLTVDGEKMSKSLGNFYTVRQLLEEGRDEGWDGEDIRFALLNSNYRQPLDFSISSLRQAKAELNRFYTSLRAHRDIEETREELPLEVQIHLEDDLDIRAAIARMHEIRTDLNNQRGDMPRLKGELLAAGRVLGVLQRDPDERLKGRASGTGNLQAGAATVSGSGTVRDGEQDEHWINEMIEKRASARKAKDFKQADRIRDELAAQGVVLEDGPGGTMWRRA